MIIFVLQGRWRRWSHWRKHSCVAHDDVQVDSKIILHSQCNIKILRRRHHHSFPTFVILTYPKCFCIRLCGWNPAPSGSLAFDRAVIEKCGYEVKLAYAFLMQHRIGIWIVYFSFKRFNIIFCDKTFHRTADDIKKFVRNRTNGNRLTTVAQKLSGSTDVAGFTKNLELSCVLFIHFNVWHHLTHIFTFETLFRKRLEVCEYWWVNSQKMFFAKML